MLKPRLPPIAVLLVLLWLGGAALAARNSSGTYSLPAGNPVVTGTTISSTWANNTLNDIKTEITNSLDRQGRGAMLAPLQIVSGTAAAPGLTGSAEPSSGLYRNAAGDWRFSVLTVPVMKWASALVTTLVPLTVTGRTTTTDLTVTGTSDALAVVSTTANLRGLSATGNGSGAGINAFGGTTSGRGISASGGAPNGVGINAQGAGTGDGIVATGGASAGRGISATGGTGGIGVSALGNGSSPGVNSTGGATSGTGVIGTGGAPNGNGVIANGTGAGAGLAAIGGATGAGLIASPGSGATGAVRTTSVWANNGDISMVGTANPDTTTAITNALTPKNIIKAWGTIDIDPGNATATLVDGFNISGIALSNNNWNAANVHGFDTLDVTFAAPFASANYAVTVGGRADKCTPFVYLPTTSASQVSFNFLYSKSFPTTSACSQSTNTGYVTTWSNSRVYFIAVGAQ
jgi:hypothetical protein